MLYLNAGQQTVKWKEAGIELDLVPLPRDVDQALIEATTERVLDDNGRLVDIKRDVRTYAQKVGRHCIKGWRGLPDKEGERGPGVIDPDGNAVECTPEAVEQFMLIEPAEEFVFRKVKSLDIHLAAEVSAAKKG